jgi:hypothetical protein
MSNKCQKCHCESHCDKECSTCRNDVCQKCKCGKCSNETVEWLWADSGIEMGF